MQSSIAVVTMVRDDDFFLEKWVSYYGAMFGKENLYVVNHGHQDPVKRIAEGCNLIGIPGEAHRNFEMKRWRLLNSIAGGLRSYYRHVIVGDVDELVVVDPATGVTLRERLEDTRGRQVLTPLGLEVVHRTDREQDSVADGILGPRRYVRTSMEYSKPCIVSADTKIARGGHFAKHEKLTVPDDMYLFHLKFCDFGLFCHTMDKRNSVVQETRAENPRDAALCRHWFPQGRDDDETFAGFRAMPVDDGFDFTETRKTMYDTWQPRGKSGFWNFTREETGTLNIVPERFFGLF